MKVAFVVLARDKAGWLARAIHSAFVQTYAPMTIVLSDHGSTDGSREIFDSWAHSYNGPNKIVRLNCPLTDKVGMEGANAHVNWICDQLDEDIVLILSGDDLSFPGRTARVVRAYEEHNPAMVGTTQFFLKPGSTDSAGVTCWDGPSRFVSGDEVINNRIGGSVSISWSMDFYRKIGGLQESDISDIYLCYLATLDKGFYVAAEEPLHAYIQHADPKNAGLEGRMKASSDEDKELYAELIHSQITSTYCSAIRKAAELYCNKEHETAKQQLCLTALSCANSWAMARNELNRKNKRPLHINHGLA